MVLTTTTQTLSDVLTSYFGTYAPLTDSNGDVITGIAGVNWPWIMGVLIFMLLLYCVFTTLGKLLGGK